MKKLVLFFTATLMLTSCRIDADDISVDKIDFVEVKDASLTEAEVDLVAVVTNNSRYRVTVVEATFTLHDGDKDILTATLADKIRIHKKTTEAVEIPLKITYRNIFGLISFSGMSPQMTSRLRVSGYIKLLNSGLGHKVLFEDITLEQLGIMTGIKDLIKIK